ncbi:MAG: polysaccharide biosynthesis/export family protein, partial [Planctomycetes bacterium]|nr:polysaccharide biosynthesis/export family protein [Planctomycetota bacterium]
MWGCKEPSAIGRFRAVPITNIILDSLGVVEEEPEVFSGARDPRPEDLQPSAKEYVISPGDIIAVTIFELFGEGIQWSDNIQVSDTGRITIPVVGTLRAADLTELEFTDVIVDELTPRIISDPKVGVVVINSVEKTFSISGAVAVPGQYQLFQNDFRMLKALALSGGIPAFGTDYAYVIRTLKDQEPTEPGRDPSREFEKSLEDEGLWP